MIPFSEMRISMSAEDDRYYYEQEAAIEAFLKESLKDISEDNIRHYLGSYGDAIEERIGECLMQGEELFNLNYYGQSIANAFTAIELIIRYLLIRPLVQGAFLSDEWSEILSKRIATGRSNEDRKLLPAILKLWGVDITSLRVSNKDGLWDSILHLWKRRNAFVHTGENITKIEASTAIDCAKILLNQTVYPLATKLGFTLETTGKWHKIEKVSDHGTYESSFAPRNPFHRGE